MKLVVGLGNPGDKYRLNRHNAGFMVVDELAKRLSKIDPQAPAEWNYSKKADAMHLNFRINEEQVELVKPQTFMNETGRSVAYAANKHKIVKENIYVVHDDLDIRLGEYKITKGKGPRDHKGLLDIYQKLGSKDLWHIRVGIENRGKMENGEWKMEKSIPGEDYVLMNFSEIEMVEVERVINEINDRLIELLLED